MRAFHSRGAFDNSTATRLLLEQELMCSDVICPFWGITGAISLSHSKGSN